MSTFRIFTVLAVLFALSTLAAILAWGIPFGGIFAGDDYGQQMRQVLGAEALILSSTSLIAMALAGLAVDRESARHREAARPC